MTSLSYKCPSCGGGLTVESRFSKVVICPYCSQTCKITSDGLDPTGQAPKLADFNSIFSISCTGTIEGKKFKTLGRLRYRYDEGFWDEWFLSLESENPDIERKIWLQEDEGVFTAFEKASLKAAVPEFDDISVGSSIDINGKTVFVVERSEAVIAGGVGELQFAVRPGMSVNCVDGNSDGKLISLEYCPDEINLSIGHEISLAEIKIDRS